jgi:hypothetical protein
MLAGLRTFDPDATRAGAIGTVHPLGNDALSAKPARMGEHGKAVLGVHDFAESVRDLPTVAGLDVTTVSECNTHRFTDIGVSGCSSCPGGGAFMLLGASHFLGA